MHTDVLGSTTYTIQRDVLANLVERLDQVKAVRDHGGHVTAPLGPLDITDIKFFISLCFPRISMAWEWLNGRRLAPTGACCNPECHWEAMLQVGATAGELRGLAQAWVPWKAARASPVGCRPRARL